MNWPIRLIGKLFFIIAVFLSLFSFAMFQGGFVSWFLFFGYLPIFLLSVGLLLYPINKWQVTRTLSRYIAHSGDTITVRIRIKRSIPYPLYYCVFEEILPESLNKLDNRTEKYHYLDHPEKLKANRTMKQVVFPGFKRTLELAYQIEQVPRGEHHFQAIRIKTGDIVGFVKKEHIFQVADQLVAYPNQRLIKMTERISSFEQGSVSSNRLNLKNTNVATGIREYLPGDKFSWIDWKQTAKKNTMMTKEFEQEKSTDTVVVLDSCYYKGINLLAYEAAVEISLSMMEELKKQQSKTGFISIGKRTAYFSMQRDQGEKDLLMQHLTKVQPDGFASFGVKLKEASLGMASGSIVMIVTTHLDDMLESTIKQISQRSKRVVVHFVQAAQSITEHEHHIVKQLRLSGAVVNVLSEQQLIQHTIEVSIV